jgi:uncharacterized protein (DUF433 family)
MPLDEQRRIEIAIELDKGVSHEELERKFITSTVELKEIENLLRKKNAPSKRKVYRKKKSETDKGLILQKLTSGELPEKILEHFDVSLKVLKRWAKEEGILWYKSWSELTATEKKEIQALREEEESWEEIARAYQLHLNGEELIPPLPYQTLSAVEVGLLMEIFTTTSNISINGACQLASQAGMELNPKAVASYKRRWLCLNQ